jgi:hypothetical protein
MRVWIFQGKPERYPLRDKLVPGDKETWLVSRYRNEMSKDDVVLFWSSGNVTIRGFYGWGRITQDKAQYFDEWGYGIEVLYQEKFEPHISIEKVRESGVLNDNTLLKMPIGTNFKVSKNEFHSLSKLIASLNYIAPPAISVEE